MDKIKKIIPNTITITRIITSIIAPILLIQGNTIFSIAMYFYGMISDLLDGYTARKFNAYSELGRKLDAISDKIYALSIMLPSIILGNMYMLIPIILETIITSITTYYHFKGIKPKTLRVGKFKTASLFPTIILGLATTKLPILINLFIPLLVLSTKLQLDCITTYYNEFNLLLSKKENNEEIKEPLQETKEENEIKQKLTTKDKINDLKDELIYYSSRNISKIEPKSKPKVKILKL